jgi:hypothetical protein
MESTFTKFLICLLFELLYKSVLSFIRPQEELMARETLIQLRRGTAAAWAEANPTLNAGESGFETDTRKFKIGDGSTTWNNLQYVRIDGGSLDN